MRLVATTVLILAIVQSATGQSNLAIAAVHLAGTNTVEIAWPSESNYWYRLEQTTNVQAGAWDTVFPSTRATVPTNTYGMTIQNAGPMFWRVIGETADAYFDDVGTTNDDTQITFGTTNRDWIAQFALAGNDTQYASGNSSNDWIEQYGSGGKDQQSCSGGSGGDRCTQFGGDADDTMSACGDAGDDWICQTGDNGSDSITSLGGDGDDLVRAFGGGGSDRFFLDGGTGNDNMWVLGDLGDDNFTMDVSSGQDCAWLDGGPDDDTLTIYSNNQSFTVYDAGGSIMYQTGVDGSAITVLNVEHGTIIGNDGVTPVYSW